MSEALRKLDQTLDSILDLLEYIRKDGKDVSLSPEVLATLQTKGGGPFKTVDQPKASAPPAKTSRKPSVTIQSLEDIRLWIGDCTRCNLHKERNKIVFGAGNPDAELMFIGEGPGYDEDRQGEPFVGAAGRLLTAMIEGGMKKTRQDVYIANIVKCHPPNNRDPQPNESETCMPFLVEQIRIIQPKVICALGRIAAHNLLQVQTPISKMRGTWYEFMGIKVMPTFHPAALLRNPANKRPAWEDLKMIMAELGWK